MKPENYFKVAEEMLLAAMNESDGLTARTATTRVLRLGCKALEQVILDMKEPDGDLHWAWRHLNELHAEDIMEHNYRLRSIQTVLDTFLVAEANAFEKYRVPSSVQKFILMQARDLISDLDSRNMNNLKESSWIRVSQNIGELKENVCAASKQLGHQEVTTNLLKRGAFVLSGAGVIGLNASVDAITTFGLAPWMTQLSGNLGTKLMERGIE